MSDEWVLVPKIPTAEMKRIGDRNIAAASSIGYLASAESIYFAMLAVAPQSTAIKTEEQPAGPNPS